MTIKPKPSLLLAVLLAFVAMFLCGTASATNAVYLAQTAQGGNTGVDCVDAKAISYFNTSGNWSATPTGIQIGPDTTVHLCSNGGNITTNIAFHGSGSSGHPVILDGTGATMAGEIDVIGFAW